MSALIDGVMDRHGRFDVAVNNAGIGGPIAPVGEYPIDGWRKVLSVNLDGVFYSMRYEIPAMLRSGGGSIVNVASILGWGSGSPSRPHTCRRSMAYSDSRSPRRSSTRTRGCE
jgi:NAD(P)-dependent dehydrogenase (short-subunit alcohol dehydrogenase family)